jgi:hypothetical protein
LALAAERDQLRAALRELEAELPSCDHYDFDTGKRCNCRAFRVEHDYEDTRYYCDRHAVDHDCGFDGPSWAGPRRAALTLLEAKAGGR